MEINHWLKTISGREGDAWPSAHERRVEPGVRGDERSRGVGPAADYLRGDAAVWALIAAHVM